VREKNINPLQVSFFLKGSSIDVHSNGSFEQGKPQGETKVAVNEDDYLIRYKISMFMHDPKKAAFDRATYSEYEEPKNPR
jgi:hypothetical protein